MSNFFEALINMSITGSVVIAVIILVRFLLKGMPKKYSYALWAVAGFRLCCPFSFKSIVSIFNINPVQKPSEIVTNSGTMNYIGTPTAFNPNVSQAVPANTIGEADGVTEIFVTNNIIDIFIDFIPYLWLAAFIGLLVYALISFVKLKKSLATATKYDGNIYQSDAIMSPFILGIIKPKIYIPYGVDSEYLDYVIVHEKYHLKRGDNVIKVLAFVILAMHCFNPLCWAAFSLFNKDMEMSCDEWVLAHNDNIKKQYSTALLSFATNKHFPSPSPLCFGEDSAKSRIKNVLKFKKPTVIISVLAVAVCIVIAVICIANPKSDTKNNDSNIDISDIVDMNIGAGMPNIIYADDDKIIFDGTAGVITYDYNNGKITDRIAWKDIDNLKWTDDADYHGIASVSENGETIYLTEVGSDNKAHYKYTYNTDKKKFKSLGDKEINEQIFVPESINAYEGNYVKYIDNSFLTSDSGALLDNKLLYLRANPDWSMKSLQLVTCDLTTDNQINVKDIFVVDTETTVNYLYNLIMNTVNMDKYLDRVLYIDEIIPEVTGADYLGDSGSGLYRYDFKYNDIDFTITSSTREITGFEGVTFSVNGKTEFAYDKEAPIVFNGLKESEYEPFHLKTDYTDFNNHAFSGKLKNQYGGVFKIVDADKKYGGIEGFDSSYTKAIEYEYGNIKQTVLITFYNDLDLLAYIDDELFFSAGDTLYKIYLTYNDNKIILSNISYIYYGQYSIIDAKEDTLILQNGNEKLYLYTVTGNTSSWDIESYKPNLLETQAVDIAKKVLVEKSNKPLKQFEQVGIELFNGNILANELNPNGNPLYRIEFFDTKSVCDYHRIYIDAQTGDFVNYEIFGD